jgi:hypothetical protein
LRGLVFGALFVAVLNVQLTNVFMRAAYFVQGRVNAAGYFVAKAKSAALQRAPAKAFQLAGAWGFWGRIR